MLSFECSFDVFGDYLEQGDEWDNLSVDSICVRSKEETSDTVYRVDPTFLSTVSPKMVVKFRNTSNLQTCKQRLNLFMYLLAERIGQFRSRYWILCNCLYFLLKLYIIILNDFFPLRISKRVLFHIFRRGE